jgi:hypothetical protein
MDGGCGCGQVRYTINASQMPVVYACHCTDCQTQSGSAFALQMPMFEAMLSVSGDLITGEVTLPSGAISTVFSCPKCLMRIYTRNGNRPGMVTVRAGTLDASKDVVPKFHLWTGSRQSWVAIPEGVISLEEQPRAIEEWMRLLTPDAS